jgi:hypothetical protein
VVWSAAEATLEPHGGEWLPRQGNGKGRIKTRRRRIPEPLGDVFLLLIGFCVINRDVKLKYGGFERYHWLYLVFKAQISIFF